MMQESRSSQSSVASIVRIGGVVRTSVQVPTASGAGPRLAPSPANDVVGAPPPPTPGSAELARLDAALRDAFKNLGARCTPGDASTVRAMWRVAGASAELDGPALVAVAREWIATASRLRDAGRTPEEVRGELCLAVAQTGSREARAMALRTSGALACRAVWLRSMRRAG